MCQVPAVTPVRGRSENQPAIQTTGHPINRSNDQPAIHSAGQPIRRSGGRSIIERQTVQSIDQ
jgi:hypothetical protein